MSDYLTREQAAKENWPDNGSQNLNAEGEIYKRYADTWYVSPRGHGVSAANNAFGSTGLRVQIRN